MGASLEENHEVDDAADAVEVVVPSRGDVLTHYALEGTTGSGFVYNEDIWIKCAAHTTSAEVAAHEYAYQYADGAIFRVPKIYDWFIGGTTTFIIMERVKGITYEKYLRLHEPNDPLQPILFRAFADAVRHIHDFPVHGPPGPIDAPILEDRFFKESLAQDPSVQSEDSGDNDLLFPRKPPAESQDISLLKRPLESIADLQDWCNAKLRENHDYLQDFFEWVNFKSPKLIFCHMSVRPRHFMIAKDNQYYILDWRLSGMYPEVFEQWALSIDRRSPFQLELERELWPDSLPNFPALKEIPYIELLKDLYNTTSWRN